MAKRIFFETTVTSSSDMSKPILLKDNLSSDDKITSAYGAVVNGVNAEYVFDHTGYLVEPGSSPEHTGWMIGIKNRSLLFVPSEPDTVYHIVITFNESDPYTRSSDLVGALKYFYQEILLNGNVPQVAINEMFADAHSVLDVVRMYYKFRYSSLPVKVFAAKNLTEFFNNIGDMVSNTGSGDSGSGR